MKTIELIAKPILEKRYKEIEEEVKSLGDVSSLTIIVGERSDSELYVNMKHTTCTKRGIKSYIEKFHESTTTDELVASIRMFVASGMYDGILIQLPLPEHIDQEYVLKKFGDYIIEEHGRIEMDVDGLTHVSRGVVTPCTPKGIMTIIEEYDIDLLGKHVVVLGRSEILGKPVAQLCQAKDATVSVIHTRTTEELKTSLLKSADVIIAGAGALKTVQPRHIGENKPYIIDAGVTIVNGKSIGDVHEGCRDLCAGYTPWTGAVGPMTILSLLENIVASARKRVNG